MVLSRSMDSGSSRPNTGHVKGWKKVARLFDGWQAGLVVIATAVLAALVAVPRPVMPDEIPLPPVDGKVLAALSARDNAWAREAERDRLSFDVRSLGEAIRAYGKADADGEREVVSKALVEVRQRAQAALAGGTEPLMRLRAVQQKVFLDGIRGFEQTGQESVDLREVGGGLISMLRRSGWLRIVGGRRVVLPDPLVREVMFRKRWNEITGLDAPPFAASIEEQRLFYSFLLTHPVVAPGIADQVVRCRNANLYLLRKVEELGKVDPAYPADYARGVVLLRLGRAHDALLPLANFVDTHDTGPYVLRARNALREAQEQVADRP
jgi:hypothetical protein